MDMTEERTLANSVPEAVQFARADPATEATGGFVVMKLTAGKYTYYPTEHPTANLHDILGSRTINHNAPQIEGRYRFKAGELCMITTEGGREREVQVENSS